MTRIAAENLTIETSPDRWRIYLNGDGQERLILEATRGVPLRYAALFAQRRNLPDNALPTNQIKQVILGWSQSDQSWHLGLLLMPDLAQQRQSRWCEIAHWFDPDSRQYAAIAEQSARALAQTLDLPFRLIPPQIETVKTPIIAQLPALPLKCGLWTADRDGENIVFTLSQRWTYTKLGRIIWYSFWAVIYVLLSVATLTTRLALPNSGAMLPNPQVLPYLGLGTAVILLLIVLYGIYEIRTTPNRLVIASDDQTISAYRDGHQRWQYSVDDMVSIYVSQVVGQRGNRRIVYHGEINLQLPNGRFHSVLVQTEEEERIERNSRDEKLREEITALDAAQIDTDLQAAALYIAQTLGDVPVWYDQRTQ
ncbi:MAG: hypothetical protein MUF87_14730 [Anaerolineae bacterium]|jgi:hypothetical protein|nr:hypothetical protein [Anaerolineae bacterium]